MSNQKNRQFLLVSRPQGMPADENFKLIETDIPTIEDGQVLIRSLYLSVDPYMRGRIGSDANPRALSHPKFLLSFGLALSVGQIHPKREHD